MPTPALLADKPLAYPPTGNPRVFGPGRARIIDRVRIMLAGVTFVFCLPRLARSYNGYDIWSGFDALTKTDLLLYLFCALSLLMTGIFAAIHPVEKIILRVDDHGLTLRSLRPHVRARTFVHFALLETVKVSKIPKSTDYTVQIEMRRGAGWRTCIFAARSATGAEGPEIAAEIIRRATAAEIAVSEERLSRLMPERRLWRFAPMPGTEAQSA